jgi:hypothetical protein
MLINTESVTHTVSSFGEEITISLTYTGEAFCVSTMTRLPSGNFITGERKLYPSRTKALWAWRNLCRTTR